MKNCIKILFYSLIIIILLPINSCSNENNVDIPPKNITVPIIQTSEISNISYYTATSGGNIINDGGPTVTEKGVCWSIGLSPTLADDKTFDGVGVGSYTSLLTGLKSNTTYNLRSYATNSAGTAYGNTISFTTLQEADPLNYGIILKTTDGGESWISLKVENAINLHSIYFINELTGYAVGERGIITKTTDGGLHWTTQYSIGWILYDVYFINENIGYAVGNHHTILKTIDAGTTWIIQDIGTTYDLNSVFFTDINNGYIVGQNGIILRTSNGGVDWDIQYTSPISTLNSVLFTDAKTGYAAGNNGVYKTIDGGVSWEKQIGFNRLKSIFNIDLNTIYVVGYGGTVYKTVNAGLNWVEIASTLNYDLTTVFFTSSDIGYVAGYAGDIFKTIDGGLNWVKKNSGTSYIIESIYFTNNNTGFAVGYMK